MSNLKFKVMKKFNSIEEFAANMVKGSFGLYTATFTEKKMNKFPCDKSAARVVNPYLGRVFNLAIIQNAASGVSYYKLVESECKREGISFSKDAFAAAFPYEKTYCEGASDKLDNIIMEHNTSGQRYLRLYFGRKPTKTIYHTILTDADGKNARVITEKSAEWAEIQKYTPVKNESKKQEALGISNIIEVRQPKIENVVFMMQGEKLWTNERFAGILNESTLGTDMMLMFKK